MTVNHKDLSTMDVLGCFMKSLLEQRNVSLEVPEIVADNARLSVTAEARFLGPNMERYHRTRSSHATPCPNINMMMTTTTMDASLSNFSISTATAGDVKVVSITSARTTSGVRGRGLHHIAHYHDFQGVQDEHEASPYPFTHGKLLTPRPS
jgi:hypothetical protein